jgi:hypothetical protein
LHFEGVWEVTDFAHSARFQQHFHNIEPHFNRRVLKKPQVIQPGTRQAPAALGIDRGRRPSPFLGRTRFDFDENQAITIPEDEVDFAPGCSEICGQELQAIAFEVFAGRTFA